jgi:phosphoenolpyruvate carboxylase
VEESVLTSQIEQLVTKAVESRLKKAMKEYVEKTERQLRELSLFERTVRVEERLRSMREMSELKSKEMEKHFKARLLEINARLDVIEKRFLKLQCKDQTLNN